MKKPISTYLFFFILMQFLLITCKNDDNPLNQNNSESDDKEIIVEQESKTIDSNGGEIKLSDDTKIIIPKDAVNKETKIILSKIQNDNVFSGSNRVVIDINTDNPISEMTLMIRVEKGLTKDDLGLFLYNPDDSKIEVVLKGIRPDFEYDSQTGFMTSTITSKMLNKNEKIQGKLKYPRIVADWNQNIQAKQESKIIQVPFYEQPGNTCWATCATMLTKCYTPYKDRNSESEVLDYLKYLKISKDEGISCFSFLHELPNAFHVMSGGAGVETTGYFRLSALREKIISEIDKDRPVIISLNYPGIAKHAILIVGYTKKTENGKTVYDLIYHNPQGTGNETMYSVHSIDWIFKEKSYFEAVQVLYSTNLVHPERTLLTLGLPLDGNVGDIAFKVPFKTSQYHIHFADDLESLKGYSWKWNSKKFNPIPDSASELQLKLPIWNADINNSKSAILKLEVFSGGYKQYEFSENLNIPNSKQAYWFEKNINLDDIRHDNDSSEYYFKFTLLDGNTYADGFDFYVNLNNKIKPVITSITPLNKYPDDIVDIHGKHFGNEPKYSERKITFNDVEVNSFYIWQDTLIRCTIPKFASSGNVIVSYKGQKSNAFFYQIGTDDLITLKINRTINHIYKQRFSFGNDIIAPASIDSISYEYSANINGTIKGTNLKETIPSTDYQFTYDVLMPGKLEADVNLQVYYKVANNKITWEGNYFYNGYQKLCKFEVTVSMSNITTPHIVFNDQEQYDDLLKYIPYTHSADVLEDNKANYKFSVDIPTYKEIAKIQNEHNISVFNRRICASLFCISYVDTIDIVIKDAKVDTLVRNINETYKQTNANPLDFFCDLKEK